MLALGQRFCLLYWLSQEFRFMDSQAASVMPGHRNDFFHLSFNNGFRCSQLNKRLVDNHPLGHSNNQVVLIRKNRRRRSV